MALDLEAIRKRVAEMTGQGKNSRVQLWKPAPGKHRIRIIPWKTTVVGVPFLERRYYYIGDAPRFLAPLQFGKPDPVNDLIKKCYSTGKPEDRELAKKLYPKMTAYSAIIDRADEAKGPQAWGFNSFVYQRLLTLFEVDGVGDYMDPLTGFDLDITIAPSKKMYKNKPVMDTTIDAVRTQTKLSNDPAQMQKWIDGIPNIDDMYPQKTTAEIEQILNTWLASGATGGAEHDEGTTRGAQASKDALDQLADDIKASAAEAKPARKPAKKAPEADIDEAAEPAAKKSLDDVFKELEDDIES